MIDDLHPSAAANFAQRATELVNALVPADPLPNDKFRGPLPPIAEEGRIGLTGLLGRHSSKGLVPEFRSHPFELEQLAR